MRVNGYKAHLTENELSMDRGKNFVLSIMSHSMVFMNCGGGFSTVIDMIEHSLYSLRN